MYENDIKTGRLTREQALEMMQAFIIKCAELMWMSSELGAKYFAGYQPFINLTVGGQTASGGDACNDLTLLDYGRSTLCESVSTFTGLSYP